MTKPLWVLGIGGMKCGSTTLDSDLRRYFGLNLLPKESSSLRRVTDQTRDLYVKESREFDGEVCATYTMHPEVPSVASIAAQTLCDTHRVRIIYLVRDPVERIESHLHHDVAIGRVAGDRALDWRSDARFLQYSSYFKQYQQWADHFPSDAIFVLPFETYTTDRAASLERIGVFLDRTAVRPLDGFTIENASQDKQVVRGPARRLVDHPAYHTWRARLPPVGVKLARRLILRSTPPRTATLDDDDRLKIEALLAGDRAELRRVSRSSAPWMEN